MAKRRKFTFEEFVRLGAAAGASKAGKTSAAKLTPEQRQERALKVWRGRRTSITPRVASAQRKLTLDEFVRMGAAAGASKAGKASAAKLTAEQRQERARKAVQARWARARAEREAELNKARSGLLDPKERRKR